MNYTHNELIHVGDHFYDCNGDVIKKTALEESNTNIAYLLGRLFSIIETQTNFTGAIWYAVCSENPRNAFNYLLIWAGKKFKEEEIFAKCLKIGFPQRLTSAEQCIFAVGYYHQKFNDK